ncbi:MAG: hypothetical protein KF708_05395 [Pirellulales bacterium]|nr:hypothetical protein [Pirellulales bacterium]
MKRVVPAVIVLLLATASQADAQWGPYYGGWHASTAAEGYQRGMADLVRSQGMANLFDSMAVQNLEAARSQELDNRLKATQTYFEMRQMNHSYLAAERAARNTRSPGAEPFRNTPKVRLERPGAADLDPVTGSIDWPLSLQTQDYAQYRQELDTLFSQRAQNSGHVDPQIYEAISATADGLLQALLANIRNMRPQDYTDAKSFVENLQYEGRFPAT